MNKENGNEVEKLLYKILEKTMSTIFSECASENIPPPSFIIREKIREVDEEIAGLSEDGMILLSENKIRETYGKTTEFGFECELVEAIFHELAHYLRVMRLNPEEREKYFKRMIEDPEFRGKEERRASVWGALLTFEFREGTRIQVQWEYLRPDVCPHKPIRETIECSR